MIQEIVEGVDIHTLNAISIFGDNAFRQEAKVVSFRSLYGGSAFAFYADPKMPNLSLPEWETIHTNFYNKYSGLGAWQHANFELVNKQGWYSSFTGRRYFFQKNQKRDGSWEYSWPAVCNYQVQGTATGDIVPLVMVHLLPKFRRLSSNILMINQVHDSIVIDCPDQYVAEVCKICIDMFRNIPKLVKKYYNYDWITPMDGECKYGPSWGEMEEFKY